MADKDTPNRSADEPTSDPVPTGEDVVNRDDRGHDTPRRYDDPVDDLVLPSDDATLNTQI